LEIKKSQTKSGKEYSKDFTVALKLIDVFNQKQMCNSVITGKENASKDWNCIISMFLTSFNICFVFVHARFMCICPKTAIWLFWGIRSAFLAKRGWQPWLQTFCRMRLLSAGTL